MSKFLTKMKKGIIKSKENFKHINKNGIIIKTLVLGLCLSTAAINAHAGIETGKLDSFTDVIDFLCSAVTKLGLGLGIWGGIDIALALKDGSAEGKDKGMKLLLSGLALICVGASASYFKGL